ncbi:hypothetical protein WICPIJ_003741 [Wickerhamomyces pijperi]|uniref:Xrn1 N-terminal domain-containing protein n=1 Tax=Wickerhamomyces pijperi TaxID=599730 RepID=A0A9P8Q791_WICPI|nr:hypothetical protein WICPIJ_003741 [Wickerhamomyces pijperi]
MAIPKFYYILTTRYPSVHSKLSTKQSCDHLLLDLNAILHNCLDRSKSENDIITLLKEYTKHLIFLLEPKKSVLLAVDGVPPLAKIKEQAVRRKCSRSSSGIDKNCLTPGTRFMELVCDTLEEYVDELMAEHPGLYVEVSTSKIKGEGEQKMMRYLKKYSKQKFILFSPDADLIVMTMQSNDNEVSLIREPFNYRLNNTRAKRFEILNIKSLKNKLTESMVGIKQQTALRDLMLMFMIMGNDLLPSPQGLGASDSTIQLIIGSLCEYYKAFPGRNIIDDQGLIGFKNLFKLFEIIQMKQLDEYKRLYPPSAKILQEKVLQLIIPVNSTLSEKKKLIKDHLNKYESEKFDQWRISQYKGQDYKKIGEEYLQRLQWLYDYYTQHLAANDYWTFDHDLVPYIPDLLHCKPPADFKDNHKDKEITQLVQLSLVTPLGSIGLLPLSYQSDSQIKKYLTSESQEKFQFEKLDQMIGYLSGLEKDPESLTSGLKNLSL